MAPLVSVIIPAYNIGKLIAETLDSVLAQTYKDLEIIVVDDGSTDDTAAAVKSFNDDRIKYYYQPNSGLPAKARNAGIKHAKGEYLAFLDHDDLWFPSKLEKQIAIVQSDPLIALVSSNAYIMRNTIKTTSTMISGLSSGYFSPANLFPSNKVIQSSTLVNKQLFIQAGGLNEAPILKAIEDYDLWLRLFAHNPCYYLDECLIYYRVLGSSASGSALKIVERELAHYHKYLVHYGYSKEICNKRLSLLYSQLSYLQLFAGDNEWRKNMRKTFYQHLSFRQLFRCLVSYLPYQAALAIYRLLGARSPGR